MKNDKIKEHELKGEINYCAFIDVLGYGNIVFDENRSTQEKINILVSIYMNLFSSISSTIKEINENCDDKIFIKSFSDSVYLETKNLESLLFACYQIFNIAFNYYINFSQKEKYTPLLRAGIVKDWSLRIMDIASLTRQPYDQFYKNDEFNNIIGLGIARSYTTAEKSNLSGMRLIISPEVIGDIQLKPYKDTTFESYYFDCQNFIKLSWLKHNPKTIPLFFTPIRKNEKNQIVNLYENCWPVFRYAYSRNKTDILHHVNEIIKMKINFDERTMRHYIKTSEIIKKAFLITLSINDSVFSRETIESCLSELENITDI
ncbi:MAG: hypothetical protein FVQ77_14100 [Cytophagales bacterium]|nr:hypothetical protein [Cytophagales bacterium]